MPVPLSCPYCENEGAYSLLFSSGDGAAGGVWLLRFCFLLLTLRTISTTATMTTARMTKTGMLTITKTSRSSKNTWMLNRVLEKPLRMRFGEGWWRQRR